MTGWVRAVAHTGLIVLGLGASFIVIEVGLRMSRGRSPLAERSLPQLVEETAVLFEYDAMLGWRGKPHARGTLGKIPIRLNSFGFREREISISKTKEVVRILVLGDSQTWGLGVEEDQRFTNLLQKFLLARGVSAEVLNFGVNGYGTDQELLLFTRVRARFLPDLVIVAFYWNDLFENSLPEAYGYPKPHYVLRSDGGLAVHNVPVPKSPDQRITGGLAADTGQKRQGTAWEVWGRLKGWMDVHLRVYGLVAGFVRQSTRFYPLAVQMGIAAGPRHDPDAAYWKITKGLLLLLRESVERVGGELLVAVIPEKSDFDAGTHNIRGVLIEDMRPLRVLDLYPSMATAGRDQSLYYRNDIHLNAKGHRVIAHRIFEYLIGSNLLAGKSSERENRSRAE